MALSDIDVGAKIKELRLSRGMTLEELGNAVGVTKSTVRKWENGIIANMRRDKVAKVADALGVSPSVILGWTDTEQGSPNTQNASQPLQVVQINSDPQVEKLIQIFNSLDDFARNYLLTQAEFLLTEHKKTSTKDASKHA